MWCKAAIEGQLQGLGPATDQAQRQCSQLFNTENLLIQFDFDVRLGISTVQICAHGLEHVKAHLESNNEVANPSLDPYYTILFKHYLHVYTGVSILFSLLDIAPFATLQLTYIWFLQSSPSLTMRVW